MKINYYKITLYIVFFLIIWCFTNHLYSQECTNQYNFELRKGHSYEFSNIYTNPSLRDTHVLATFDISKPDGMYFNNVSDGIIPPDSSEEILKSNRVTINDTSKFNIIYRLTYRKRLVSGKMIGPYEVIDCCAYNVSYCGDGEVQNKYGEECDDKQDPKNCEGCKILWKQKK